MFVFKAAVVGAGTMGGEIAQVLASADVDVVLKDVDQKFIDTGPREGQGRDERPARPPREEGEDHPGAGRRAGRRDPRPHHRHDRVRGLRRRRLRDRGRAGADEDQAGRVRRARRGHAGPRDPRLEHLGAVDHRDGRGHQPRRQGLRLPLLLPRVDDAPDRGDRGRRDLRGDHAGRLQLRPADPQAADPLRRGARLRRQPHPQLRRSPRSGRPWPRRASTSRRSTR